MVIYKAANLKKKWLLWPRQPWIIYYKKIVHSGWLRYIMWFFVLWLDGLNDLVSIADNSGSGFIITTTDNELVEPLFDIIVIVGDKTAENKELQRLRFKFIDNDGETHIIQILYDDDSWFEWCFLCRGVFDFFSNRKVLYVILKKRNIINHWIFPHLGTYPNKRCHVTSSYR